MEPKDNPFLQIENPYAEVKNKRDEASKPQLELMQLCWNIFHVEPNGKRLIELLTQRYLMQTLFHPDHPNCKEQALFWEGFKEAIRRLYNLGLQHQQYITGVEASGRQPNTISTPNVSTNT